METMSQILFTSRLTNVCQKWQMRSQDSETSLEDQEIDLRRAHCYPNLVIREKRFACLEVFARDPRLEVSFHPRDAIQISWRATGSFCAPFLERRGLSRLHPYAWSFSKTIWE